MFSTAKKEKYHPSSTPNGYKQWFRRLRTTFRPTVLKEALTAENLQGVDILVLGAPTEKFSLAEFDTLKGGGRPLPSMYRSHLTRVSPTESLFQSKPLTTTFP